MTSQILTALRVFLVLGVISAGTSHRCQPVTPERHLPPKIPHQTLNESFLQNFEEILVIGDVHGCYDEQQMLLQKANATGENVLKIFTGDITRGGPKNLQVVHFVKNSPSALTVRGNNDEKTLLRRYAYDNDNSNYTLKPLDKWMAKMTPEDIEFLRELPYTISIPTLNAIIVHAGILPGVPVEENRPYTLMNLRDLIPDPKCKGGYRSTRLEFITYPWASKWNGPMHVYFGHDHKRQLQEYSLATGIDTSCCRGHFMTGLFISGPRNGTYVTQEALHHYYPGKV